MQNNRTGQKLLIYISSAFIGAFLAGAAAMDDNIVAKMSWFKWLVFWAGCISSSLAAWRAFIDKSTANEDKQKETNEKDTTVG